MTERLSYAPAELNFTYQNDAAGAVHEMDNLLKQQICFACYAEALTAAEIAKKLGVAKEYIEDSVKEMLVLELLKEEDGKYLTWFNVFPTRENNEAHKLTYDYYIQNKIPARVNELLDGLEEEIRALNFYGNDFNYGYLKWIFYNLAAGIFDTLILKNFKNHHGFEVSKAVPRPYNITGFYQTADEVLLEYETEKQMLNCSCTWNFCELQDFGKIKGCDALYAPPFPNVWDEANTDWSKGRISSLDMNNNRIILKLINGVELSKLEHDMANGLALEAPGPRLIKLDGQKQIPLTPVFTNKVFCQIEKLIEKTLQPLSVEIAENLCTKLEEMFFPLIRKGEPRLIEDFYTFNLKNFIHSSSTLWWYGLNGEETSVGASSSALKNDVGTSGASTDSCEEKKSSGAPLELPAKEVGYEHFAAGLYLICLDE